MRCFPRAALWTALASLSTPALAQPIPATVITATRIPTPVQEIPAGVTVINRAAIEASGATDLAQILGTVPGLRLSQSGGAGGNASVFLRGLNSNHVLVLRDGMPLNDAADSSGAFNFGVDTLADVERIEVIRGPMGALYGSGAIGGVINLITRKGTSSGPLLSGQIAGGFPRQIQGHTVLSGARDGWDYAAIGEATSQRGFDTVPQRMSVFRDTPQGFRAVTGTLNLGYTPVDGTRFSLLLRARRADFGFNALGFPIYDNANSSGHVENFLGRIGATTKFLNGSLESSLFFGRLEDDRRYTQRLDPNDPNQATNDSRFRASRTDLQWNNILHLSDYLDVPWLSATDVTLGYAHTEDAARVRVRSSFFGSPYDQSADAGMVTDAGHAGLQTTLWDRLTVTGQLRQDAVLGHTPLTWRAGAVLAIPEFATRLKAAIGTAFRAPSLFDRYGVDSFGYVGNPALRPETARGWELGFTTDIPGFGKPDIASVAVSYFNNRVRNLIIVRFDPVYTSVNISAARTQGVETELTLRPAAWLSAKLVWTYTGAQDAITHQRLLRRPQNMIAASASVTPLPGLTITPGVSYTGPFRDFLIDNGGFSTDVGRSPPGLIINLNVAYALNPKLTLFATGRNLTNSRFEPVNGLQGPGASGLAGVRMAL